MAHPLEGACNYGEGEELDPRLAPSLAYAPPFACDRYAFLCPPEDAPGEGVGTADAKRVVDSAWLSALPPPPIPGSICAGWEGHQGTLFVKLVSQGGPSPASAAETVAAAAENLQRLHDTGDKYANIIDFERQNIQTMEEQIQIMKQKILHQRRAMGGINASKDNHYMIQKQIREKM